MLNPLRKRPEEPPSSVTVTNAARSLIQQGSQSTDTCPGTATCRRKPRSSVESPVPPPIATTRKGMDGTLMLRELKDLSFGWVRGWRHLCFDPKTPISNQGASGYSSSVNRGSSCIDWKSVSVRACRRFLELPSIARARCSRHSSTWPVIASNTAKPYNA